MKSSLVDIKSKNSKKASSLNQNICQYMKQVSFRKGSYYGVEKLLIAERSAVNRLMRRIIIHERNVVTYLFSFTISEENLSSGFFKKDV